MAMVRVLVSTAALREAVKALESRERSRRTPADKWRAKAARCDLLDALDEASAKKEVDE